LLPGHKLAFPQKKAAKVRAEGLDRWPGFSGKRLLFSHSGGIWNHGILKKGFSENAWPALSHANLQAFGRRSEKRGVPEGGFSFSDIQQA
jgi:hypothetical protein